ncbi:MAG: peroxiredoxin [Deltaproteobacteria bacterium]|nr:MAG: peroxiredoxin [Deltaproteobacteria bacterium]
MEIKEGVEAPNFKLKNQKGEEVSLSQFRGKKNVVLYFYPKDDTPGCTKEACTFRDQYEVFMKQGAEVIGVSSDSVDSHSKFSQKYHLPFSLLSDEGGALRKLYNVPKTMGLFPGRVTYVIDREGIVRKVFSSQLNATQHVEEALKALQ